MATPPILDVVFTPTYDPETKRTKFVVTVTTELSEGATRFQDDAIRLMGEIIDYAVGEAATRISELPYKKCVEELKEWAEQLMGCGHEMCTMAESAYEEIYGARILDRIRKYSSA